MAEELVKSEVEFVRKDIFDARMDRMEALLEKTLFEMKADNERLRSEVNSAVSQMKADNEKLRSEIRENNLRLEAKIEAQSIRIDSLNTRVDTLQTSVYWGFAVVTVAIGALALLPVIGDFLKNMRKPSVTLDDVKSVVNEALRQNSMQKI